MKKDLQHIIESVNNYDKKLILCSSHDSLISIIAKYYAIDNNIYDDLELPHYLSNVRIEQWSDNIIRIFYK